MSNTQFSRGVCFDGTDADGSALQSGTLYDSSLDSGSGANLHPAFQHVFQPANDPDSYEPVWQNFDILQVFQDGSKQAYNSGRDNHRRWQLGWSYASTAEKDNFIDWFERTGKRQSFSFTDPYGSTYTVRMVSDLEVKWRANDSYDIALTLEEES